MAETLASSFEIMAPARWTVPLVFNSPHSGTNLPLDLLNASALSQQQLRASEDSHVDELFSGCLEAGAPLMRALVSRAYVDLNREPYELDARMFRDRLPGYVNCASPRVASGLGTIPRTVGDGLMIYHEAITFADAVARIETLYRPYHRALGALMDEAHAATGLAVLVDCHSMPSSAVSHMRLDGARKSVDVVLGDRFNSACDATISNIVEERLQRQGLNVSRNKPYSGGFFTENHGRPRQNRHALQIEINRALYMDEATHEPNGGFVPLRETLSQLAKDLALWTQDRMSWTPTLKAAE